MTNTTSGFDLFSNGHFREAIEAYSQELTDRRTALTMANRALARLAIEDYDGAMADYQAAEELHVRETGERTDAYQKRIAAALWMLGRKRDALAAWAEIVDGLTAGIYAFSDAAGGAQAPLLLWFGACSLADGAAERKALSQLKKLLRKAASRNWPGAVARFVLHELEYSELMQCAQDNQPLSLRRGCQAAFYAAVRARHENEDRDSYALFRMAVEYGQDAGLEIEGYLAAYELRSS